MPLTDTYIRSLKVADKEQKHFDGGGPVSFHPQDRA